MDQTIEFDEKLDIAYSPSQWVVKTTPEEAVEKFFSEISEGSKTAKLAVQCHIGVSYGSTENQKVDIFGIEALPSSAPVFIFLHGGYWHIGSREISSNFAYNFFEAGIVSVIMGYDLAPAVTVEEIVDEIKRGMNFLGEHLDNWNSRKVFVCGHSAGAHLAAMLISSKWMENEYAKSLKGVIAMSGIYELEPLLYTSVRAETRITMETVQKVSPMRYVDKAARYLNNDAKVYIAVADHDSPVFQNQSKEYERHLRNKGVATKFFLVPNSDHFTLIQRLSDPTFILTKVLHKQILCLHVLLREILVYNIIHLPSIFPRSVTGSTRF